MASTLPDPSQVFSWRQMLLLARKAVQAWMDDRASSLGAAIAYYTLFSLDRKSVV